MNHKTKVSRWFMAVTVLLPTLATNIQGHGIAISDHDAQATARGNAFVATADNPSAVYHNPAGITQLAGWQVRAGAYALTYQARFSGTGETVSSRRAYEGVPHIYYTHSLPSHPLSLGLGLYSPFGLSMEWPQDSGFRSAALRGEVQYLTVQPVIAWRIWEGMGGAGDNPPSRFLSVAAGPTLNYARTDLRQGLSPIPGNDSFRFSGDAFAPGFSAGILWRPLERHSFGVTYRSATTVDYSGRTEIVSLSPPLSLRQDARAEFEFPQSVTFGWSWRPTPVWNLEVNANWTDWTSFDEVPIRQSTPVPPLTLNWRSSWWFAGGITRSFHGNWRVSAGYVFSENSVPDQDFSPLVPDSDRHVASVGIGRTMGRWNWDVAYQLTHGVPRTVSGSTSIVADGRYDLWSHALSASVGTSF